MSDDNNSSIDRMADQFKSVAELQVFASAQTRTIIEQSKKITKLEEEVKSLKKDLLNSTPKENTESVSSELLMGSDQDIICKIQINRFKEMSLERELTLEEAKKLDIFTKILLLGKEKKKVTNSNGEEVSIENLDLKDLMASIENG